MQGVLAVDFFIGHNSGTFGAERRLLYRGGAVARTESQCSRIVTKYL